MSATSDTTNQAAAAKADILTIIAQGEGPGTQARRDKLAPRVAPDGPGDLGDLLRAFDAAYEGWQSICAYDDYISPEDPLYSLAGELAETASNAEDAARDAVIAYAPKSLAELAMKTAAVTSRRFAEGDKAMDLAFLAEDAARLDQSSAEWEAAREIYEAGRAAAAEAQRVHEFALDAARTDAAVPAILVDRTGAMLLSERAIELSSLSFADKVKAMSALPEYNAKRLAAYELHRVTETDDEAVRVEDEVAWPAAKALLALQPPTATALAQQVRVWIDEFFTPHIGEHADDPATIARLLSSDDHAERFAANIYQRALRLAGLDSPALEAEAFDAIAWIANFEAEHGVEFDRVDGEPLSYSPDRPRTMGPTNPPPAVLKAWRALPTWKRTAVKRAAKKPDARSLSHIIRDIRFEVSADALHGAVDREAIFVGHCDENDLTRLEIERVRLDLDRFGWADPTTDQAVAAKKALTGVAA